MVKITASRQIVKFMVCKISTNSMWVNEIFSLIEGHKLLDVTIKFYGIFQTENHFKM